ncbi:hypothetical protein J6590_027296 [Homalodisca vitripennis]|nr:hypothetical protein J6590_027296 [Homalodisca vitripennis]
MLILKKKKNSLRKSNDECGFHSVEVLQVNVKKTTLACKQWWQWLHSVTVIGSCLIDQLFRLAHQRTQVIRGLCEFKQGARSEFRNFKHGVPHNPVLGPLLFLILTNDLHVEEHSLLFANDTILNTHWKDLLALKRDADKLLRQAKQWFDTNTVKLNAEKPQHLLCTLKGCWTLTPEVRLSC